MAQQVMHVILPAVRLRFETEERSRAEILAVCRPHNSTNGSKPWRAVFFVCDLWPTHPHSLSTVELWHREVFDHIHLGSTDVAVPVCASTRKGLVEVLRQLSIPPPK